MPKTSFTAFSRPQFVSGITGTQVHTTVCLRHYWGHKLTLLAFVMNLLNFLWKENKASGEGREASPSEVLEAMPWWRQLPT